MKYNPAIEAEFLVEVQRAKVAFLGASHRCKELGTDRVAECMEPASRNYVNALGAFSDLVLNGKVRQRSQSAISASTLPPSTPRRAVK
jgi:hypothetical protein